MVTIWVKNELDGTHVFVKIKADHWRSFLSVFLAVLNSNLLPNGIMDTPNSTVGNWLSATSSIAGIFVLVYACFIFRGQVHLTYQHGGLESSKLVIKIPSHFTSQADTCSPLSLNIAATQNIIIESRCAPWESSNDKFNYSFRCPCLSSHLDQHI